MEQPISSAKRSRREKMLRPPISALEILRWGVALSALIGGALCVLLSYSDHSTTELAFGVAALFMSLRFFALSQGLRALPSNGG
jgi:hypothetical protein